MRSREGFTLIETLIAAALLGFSLVVMFGFHSQAVRSNMHARKITDCTYLAQLQLEELLSLAWTAADRPSELDDGMDDNTGDGDEWGWLEHPNSGSEPSPVNAANETDGDQGVPVYFVTWDIHDMDDESTWIRMRVRCTYEDAAFNAWRGTTVASYRFRDS